MPFDEQVAKDKADQLRQLGRDLASKQRSISDVHKNLMEILDRVEYPDGLHNPPVITPARDQITKKPLTPARRDEIYNEMIAQADDLLS